MKQIFRPLFVVLSVLAVLTGVRSGFCQETRTLPEKSFINYILPIPSHGSLSKDAWGAVEVVIDTPKEQQPGNNGHGSKIIVVPFDGAALDRDLQDAKRIYQIAEGPFTPKRIAPEANGKMVLRAVDAVVNGQILHYKCDDNIVLSAWSNGNDSISWELDVPAPSEYGVEMVYSCSTNCAGSKYMISTGKHGTSGKSVSTGSEWSFKPVKTGVIKFEQAGNQTLSIKPESITDWKAMGLQSITLTPAKYDLTIEKGAFDSSENSFKRFRCPDWFRDAKLGIWAHWGPQAVPGCGDWYASCMYDENSGLQRPYQMKHYGHPSKFGFKDIIPLWKAEKWDPARLMDLYQKAGAKYFCATAVHHDNFDLWNSKYQPRWNSVNIGPRKDMLAIWKEEARKRGLRFGVTEHLAYSWAFYSGTKKSDTKGPFAGIPYDGTDPAYADLYYPDNANATGDLWIENAPPWFRQLWFNRVKDLVDQLEPDLLYSDCGVAWGDIGRSVMAHFYNKNMKQHGGRLDAVYNCKQGGGNGWVLDIERGQSSDISKEPWQTDTCLGHWYYRTGYKYKTFPQVMTMLMDIVSKNGNLLLNFPLRGDGSLDEEEETVLANMAKWMSINSEAVFGTRPFKVYGEGPSRAASGSFGEDKAGYTAADVRFTTKGDILYATCLGVPTGAVTIETLKAGSSLTGGEITGVKLLGYDGKLDWKRTEKGLVITMPEKFSSSCTVSFRISGLKKIEKVWD